MKRLPRIVAELATLMVLASASSAAAQPVRSDPAWTWGAIDENMVIHAPAVQFAEPPPRSPGVIALQLLGGTAGAIIGGAIVGNFLDSPGSSRSGAIGWALGSTIGTTLTVYGIGREFNARGSAIGTAILPAALTVPVLLHRDDELVGMLALLMMPLQALGGTIGFGFVKQSPQSPGSAP